MQAAEWHTTPELATPTRGGAESITIPATSLPQGGQLLVSATLHLEVANSTAVGTTQLVVPIDQPPLCTAPASSSCIDVLVLDDNFPTSKLLVSAVGFADDGPLKYELGSLASGPGSRRQPIALGQQQSVEVTGLPAGNTTLYACAIDDAGQELCDYQSVAVVQPPAFDASAALLSFNLSTGAQAAAPEALAASCQLLAALVASAAGVDAATASGEAPDLAALPFAAQQAVATQASQLVMLLANGMTVQDGDGAQQALASVATVVAAAGELLSSEAKAQLLGVAQQSEWLATSAHLELPMRKDVQGQT